MYKERQENVSFYHISVSLSSRGFTRLCFLQFPATQSRTESGDLITMSEIRGTGRNKDWMIIMVTLTTRAQTGTDREVVAVTIVCIKLLPRDV